jgi:hypothetical protein
MAQIKLEKDSTSLNLSKKYFFKKTSGKTLIEIYNFTSLFKCLFSLIKLSSNSNKPKWMNKWKLAEPFPVLSPPKDFNNPKYQFLAIPPILITIPSNHRNNNFLPPYMNIQIWFLQ